jgi:hypothetical protein
MEEARRVIDAPDMKRIGLRDEFAHLYDFG